MATPRKKKRKPYNIIRFPVIGKYHDVPSKAALEVVWFSDMAGHYKLTMGNLPSVILPCCRFQLKMSDVKKKRKFYKRLETFLNISTQYKEFEYPDIVQLPLLFGLLKLRKKKQRILVWIKSADAFYKSKVINITAVVINNFLYLDLLELLKK